MNIDCFLTVRQKGSPIMIMKYFQIPKRHLIFLFVTFLRSPLCCFDTESKEVIFPDPKLRL